MRDIDTLLKTAEPIQPNISLLREYRKLANSKQFLDNSTNSKNKLFGMLRFLLDAKANGENIDKYSEEFNLILEIVDIVYEVDVSMLYY